MRLEARVEAKGTDSFALDPARFTDSEARRIHSQVDAYLTATARSPEVDDAALQALLDEVLPAASHQTPPPLDMPAPPELEDWARDDPAPKPASSPPEAPDHSDLLTSTLGGGASGGGGQVQPPFPALPHDNDDNNDALSDDDDFENRFELWQPPKPQKVVVPEDVADIAPVELPDETSQGPATDPIPTTQPPDSSGALAKSLAAVWEAMPPWMRISVPVAAALVIAIVAAVAFTGRDTATPIAGPPPTAETPPVTPKARPIEPLMPDNVTPKCPAGSSPNAGVVFGPDRSQALVCTRVFNVEQSKLIIEYNKPVVVLEICVVPGFDYVEEGNKRDHWNEHRVVTQILWNIGGTQVTQKINPTRKGGCRTFEAPGVAAQVITATIQKTERPAGTPENSGPLPGILSGPDDAKVDKSFAIGHIEIKGHPAAGPS